MEAPKVEEALKEELKAQYEQFDLAELLKNENENGGETTEESKSQYVIKNKAYTVQ